MADETPPVDEMHYEQLAQDALRGVIRSALERAAMPEGIPGAHHFYITFKTRAAGVSVPPDVLAKYPDEMTVVLQHQYWDLKVETDRFSVMLKFGGMPKVLSMPYTAVTRFYDPSVQFLLQFETPLIEEAAAEAPEPEAAETPPSNGDDGPKVVSLDQFRKK
ncbi:SspB family protein [Brevundimonas sp.]|uniref:SspB family protein n=1 Tax=Brevundimonas sp. TaxID=1871086 RepID=UPI002D441071|nr:ClpXP protease specificity-enhancing factor SspB [Brevundimonas sp.]HYC68004.1 ClpXP protease specificity-enhancing factor SspB [Brevundimonas sp.]